jgi:hypothetical protein
MTGKKTRLASAATLAIAATFGFATPASAQATRTWVSGVGNDADPCSRTAPCKTFAGALSKTANGGEINCLDPAGFGAVTINKNLVIDCHYTEGGALAGGNGIVVNATAGDTVVLRGLDIFGVNPPSNGVRILVAASVHIEDCVIRRFNAANSFGVSFQPTGSTNLYITNTTITQNGNGLTGGGILVKPTGAGTGRVIIDNVRVQNNVSNGLSIDTTGNTGAGVAVIAQNSQFTATVGNGILAVVPVGAPAIGMMLTDSLVANNSGIGIGANGAAVTIRVGNTTITGNAFTAGAGLVISNSAKINTYLDNRLNGNAVDGAFTLPGIQKQ